MSSFHVKLPLVKSTLDLIEAPPAAGDMAPSPFPALDGLRGRFTEEGFRHGRPPQLTPEIEADDRRFYGKSRCEHCGKKRWAIEVWHRADGAFRYLLTCQKCGTESEA